jgi:hypothetical protein
MTVSFIWDLICDLYPWKPHEHPGKRTFELEAFTVGKMEIVSNHRFKFERFSCSWIPVLLIASRSSLNYFHILILLLSIGPTLWDADFSKVQRTSGTTAVLGCNWIKAKVKFTDKSQITETIHDYHITSCKIVVQIEHMTEWKWSVHQNAETIIEPPVREVFRHCDLPNDHIMKGRKTRPQLPVLLAREESVDQRPRCPCMQW